MADLDVTDVLLDPDFADLLTIYRRQDTISATGRSTPNAVLITPAPPGVVLPIPDAPMERGPDQQTLPRLLEVHTPFRLRGPSIDPATGNQFQPDQISWNGDLFVVNKVQDFSRFGAGWVQADCSSVDPTDNAPQ